MLDTEVHRLRRLRNRALRARAIARALNANRAHPDSTFSRSARICWRIARVISGSLRSHPYRRYQTGPGSLRLLSDRLIAGVLGGLARHRGRSLRSQVQIHDLMDELRTAIRMAAGSRAVASPRKDVTVEAHSAAAGAKPVWPYMAF